tara:strand:- start:13244 stop:13858 length:615 start_codon:yes stop_codon:yes gene_type:complete
MYSKRTGLVLGFHGCDEKVLNSVINQSSDLKKSHNSYGWLGHGIYFWENNPDRALEYAKKLKNNPRSENQKIERPAVLGAVLDLGYCLDLLDSKNLELMKVGYELISETVEESDLPINKRPFEEENDLLIRELDCAVIEALHKFNLENNKHAFDSVRSVFFEGQDLYPNAGFKEKNHIQICIRNTNCIKGFFIPRKKDSRFEIP